jgi:hypothetical protein
MTTAISTIQQIATELGCEFFQGTLNELNQDIENKVVNESGWYFGYVSPPQVTDRLTGGVIDTTLPFTAYIVKRVSAGTSEYRTQTVQPVIDAALKKARSFFHKFNETDLIEDPTNEVRYPTIYGQFDFHLFGVGIDCEFVISEGLTGCEP